MAAIGGDLGDFVLPERLESEPGPRFDVALATVGPGQHSSTPTNLPQTVESGWMVQPGLFGPDSTLFIFFNPDGYSTNSGYLHNQNGEGFIAAPGAHWGAGVALGTSSLGPGTQAAFLMLWQRGNDGDWTLYVGNSDSTSDLSAVGYFPGQYYTPALASGADFIQFGGEVAPQNGLSPTGPMGSGIMPANAALSNYGNVAFQSHLQQQETGGTSFQDVDDSKGMTSIAPDPQFYNGAFGTDSSWGKYFFFGGGNAP